MSALKILCMVILITCVASESGFCEAPDECTEEMPPGHSRKCPAQNRFTGKRYILYDVNPGEGFNLRRDVYIRVAVFLKRLIERDKEFQWQLVLPPWGNLYHWQSRNVGSQERLPWEYSCGSREVQLDRLYILQNDEEMFKTGKFEDKNELVDCDRDSVRYHESEQHSYTGPFWGYSNVTARDVRCLKFHGMARDLSQNLMPTRYRSVMFDRMEIALHDEYGSKEYWRVRRSMRYNSELYDIAEDYRKTFLNSTNENDNTERPADWTKEKKRQNARGGPYVAVHLRRRDFVRFHKASVPTIMDTALQLQKRMDRLGLTLLFVATDAEQYEFEELKSYLSQYKVMKYVPSDYVINKFKDGGVAIIDQIICSYARYFIGTHESTFTFRIQEDREIIGFPSETTFNKLCKTNKDCAIDGFWSIVW